LLLRQRQLEERVVVLENIPQGGKAWEPPPEFAARRGV